MSVAPRGVGTKGNLVIAIFSHIEVYPPSLNALFHLAPLFDTVYVLVRNVLRSDWSYPENVKIISSGSYVPLELVGVASVALKIKSYLNFGTSLRELVREKNPSVVLLYDAIAFSLFHLFAGKSSRTKPIVWYHNHDVTVEAELRKFSLMRLMKKLELLYFRRTDFFSLPNTVRLRYFPVQVLRIEPFIIPNYPSKLFFGKWRAQRSLDDPIRLIFQGHIGKSNRIEDFIRILKKTISGRTLELHLAGPIHKPYHDELLQLTQKLNVEDRVFLHGRLSYAKLPELTSSCHIGIAIYGSHNTMVRTMSTASNKIFEYASVGLPVIIGDRQDMQKDFGGHPWILSVNETPNAIEEVLERIVSDYEYLSKRARQDFEETLNFENAFSGVMSALKARLEC